MGGLDSPIGSCEEKEEIVLLDQTQEECAAEHGCEPGCDCPLKDHFAEVSGLSDEQAEAIARRKAADTTKSD